MFNAIESQNTYGCATLVTPTLCIAAAHSFAVVDSHLKAGWTNFNQSPWSISPDSNSSVAVRFRRRPDGGLGGIGQGSEGYHNVMAKRVYSLGYPQSSHDLVLLELSEPVEHITPMPVDRGYYTHGIREGDELIWAGWGLNGNVATTGTHPGDVRLIPMIVNNDDRETPICEYEPDPLLLTANTYDSGGAQCLRVSDDLWVLIGIVTVFSGGPALTRLRHHPQFRIPGFTVPHGGKARFPFQSGIGMFPLT
jgi:hypothetical protein